MKSIKVYGPGCKRCQETAHRVEEAAAKLGLDVEIEKVTDMKAIAMAGVMATPGLAIDGHLVHTGGIPDADKVEVWLKG